MNKQSILETLKTKIEDVEVQEALSTALLELHTDAVQGMAQSKEQILDEKKKLQQKFATVEKQFEDQQSTLEKFSKIKDVDKALKALDLFENPDGKERNLVKEINDAVQERTETLVATSEQMRIELERLQKEKEENYKQFTDTIRKKDFQTQINMSAQKHNIKPEMYPELNFLVSTRFTFDEDDNDWVARDSENKPIFGKTETTKPVDVDLYIKDYILTEKPWYKMGNNGPVMNGNTDTDIASDGLFYMRGSRAKLTSDGVAQAAKDFERVEKLRQKFEAKNNKAA